MGTNIESDGRSESSSSSGSGSSSSSEPNDDIEVIREAEPYRFEPLRRSVQEAEGDDRDAALMLTRIRKTWSNNRLPTID